MNTGNSPDCTGISPEHPEVCQKYSGVSPGSTEVSLRNPGADKGL